VQERERERERRRGKRRKKKTLLHLLYLNFFSGERL
jgi:hypothetical protein